VSGLSVLINIISSSSKIKVACEFSAAECGLQALKGRDPRGVCGFDQKLLAGLTLASAAALLACGRQVVRRQAWRKNSAAVVSETREKLSVHDFSLSSWLVVGAWQATADITDIHQH
jgi:hypothetical protein